MFGCAAHPQWGVPAAASAANQMDQQEYNVKYGNRYSYGQRSNYGHSRWQSSWWWWW